MMTAAMIIIVIVFVTQTGTIITIVIAHENIQIIKILRIVGIIKQIISDICNCIIRGYSLIEITAQISAASVNCNS